MLSSVLFYLSIPFGLCLNFSSIYKNEINPFLTLKSTPLISKRICIWYLHVYSITNHATYPPFLIDAILISFGYNAIHFSHTLQNVRYELTKILFGRISAKYLSLSMHSVYALHVTTHNTDIEEYVQLAFFLPFSSLMNVKAMLMCGKLFRKILTTDPDFR